MHAGPGTVPESSLPSPPLPSHCRHVRYATALDSSLRHAAAQRDGPHSPGAAQSCCCCRCMLPNPTRYGFAISEFGLIWCINRVIPQDGARVLQRGVYLKERAKIHQSAYRELALPLGDRSMGAPRAVPPHALGDPAQRARPPSWPGFWGWGGNRAAPRLRLAGLGPGYAQAT